MADIPERHEHDSYWRGAIDTRLLAIDAMERRLQDQISMARKETNEALKEINLMLTAQLKDLHNELQSTSIMLYKIIGIGIALATIMPFLWPRLFPGGGK